MIAVTEVGNKIIQVQLITVFVTFKPAYNKPDTKQKYLLDIAPLFCDVNVVQIHFWFSEQ